MYDNAAANASDVTCDYTFDADAGGPDTRPLPMLGIFGGEMPGTGFDAYLAALRHRRFWLPAPVARRYEGLAQHDQ